LESTLEPKAEPKKYKAFISDWLKQRKMPKADPIPTKIEQLNNWLTDPLLHADALRTIALPVYLMERATPNTVRLRQNC
jgi:hypothetical protein